LKRIIGSYSGKAKGPLLLCFGSIHGNEPAGVQALERLFKMLEVEPITNPDFQFNGKLLGLRGNLQAIRKGQRFIEKDLNRQWTSATVERILATKKAALTAEDLEIKEIIELVRAEIEAYQPERLVVLDLHTTTASGGTFVVVTDTPESIQIGTALHAPVITGLLKGIHGTLLHYFNSTNWPIPTVAICFESGQHEEQLSVNRAIAAIINCMRTIGCVDATHIENKHDQLLRTYSKGLPAVANLLRTHKIQAQDNFVMRAGYKNFQPVQKGEVVADDKNGPISVEEDCLMLMPLYQNQGEDGFFLIKETNHIHHP